MKTKEPKEMISVREENGKTFVRINFSSLDILNTCMRKANYLLHQNLRNEDSLALIFGSAIHAGLEAWYLSDPRNREIPVNAHEKAQMLVLGHKVDLPTDTPFYAALIAFSKACDGLRAVPSDDKRSPENGAKILVEYFRRYKDDGLVVYRDNKGPVVERMVSFPIHEEENLSIEYFGTLDVVLTNVETKINMVTDHKTTSQLGKEFYNRVKPNHQYTGYVFGAKKALGIDTNLFMINGLQVAKTKQDFARQVTERSEEDLEELRIATVAGVKRYLEALETNVWPMSAPNPCTMYGGCTYYDVCHVPGKIKQNIINNKFLKEE